MRTTVALTLFVFSRCASATLGHELKGLGFAELSPPTTLYPPGTIIYLAKDNHLEVACTRESAYSDSLPVLPSPTAAVDVSRAIDRSFSLGAGLMKRIRADARFRKIRDVSFTLINDTIFAVALDARNHFAQYRSQRCINTLNGLEGNHQYYSVVIEALKGDVTYTVQWQDTLSIGATSDSTLKAFAATLGFVASSTGTSTVTGNGLIWGLREDELYGPVSGGHGDGAGLDGGRQYQNNRPDLSDGADFTAKRLLKPGRTYVPAPTPVNP